MRTSLDTVLAPWTTLELGGPAKRLVVLESVDDIGELVEQHRTGGTEAPIVIGSGSNILVADDGYAGTVVQMGVTGFDLKPHPDGARVLVTVRAGHRLQDLVNQMIKQGLAGLEMLTGIPGTVGATPIQNVGAYGQEVGDTITEVRVYDWLSHRYGAFTSAECEFGHRTSRFKHVGRWMIVSVTFALTPAELSTPLKYRPVARSAGVAKGTRVPLAQAASAVRDVRATKGMIWNAEDPDRRSVGSVFLSPIIDANQSTQFRAMQAPVNEFPDGSTRVSASWLMKEAGFRLGEPLAPGVKISSKHFTIVADDTATAEAFARASALVAEQVERATGVVLTAEPDLIGDLPLYQALTANAR